MNLSKFLDNDTLHATSLDFFSNQLGIKINAFDSKPIAVADFFKDHKKVVTPAVQNISKLFVVGLVDNNTLNNEKSGLNDFEAVAKIKTDYQGLVLCAVLLKHTPNRSQLADLTRLINRSFPYLPVTIIFKYDSKITFANAERVDFKQQWREGEKIGKVSMLGDVNIDRTHSGHKRILELLSIEKIREYDRKNKVDTFHGLYKAWQNVFNTNILNEQFYKDYQQLSVKLIKHIYPSQEKDKLKAHQGALNLLNRMMFVYFIQKKNG